MRAAGAAATTPTGGSTVIRPSTCGGSAHRSTLPASPPLPAPSLIARSRRARPGCARGIIGATGSMGHRTDQASRSARNAVSGISVCRQERASALTAGRWNKNASGSGAFGIVRHWSVPDANGSSSRGAHLAQRIGRTSLIGESSRPPSKSSSTSEPGTPSSESYPRTRGRKSSASPITRPITAWCPASSTLTGMETSPP